MSPQSRRSQPGGQPPGGSGSGRRRGAAPPPNALFAELLRAARELLAVRSPLDAELMVSELLGTWWGQRGGGRRAATVEQLVGEGLVDYAGEQRSPAALALLSGIACLGTSRQAAKAERAALELIEAGVPRPGWAQHLGAVTPAECYVNPDDLGDTDEVDLRVQLRRGGAARAGQRGGLQRRRDDQGRLGDLPGQQAARPLPGNK